MSDHSSKVCGNPIALFRALSLAAAAAVQATPGGTICIIYEQDSGASIDTGWPAFNCCTARPQPNDDLQRMAKEVRPPLGRQAVCSI